MHRHDSNDSQVLCVMPLNMQSAKESLTLTCPLLTMESIHTPSVQTIVRLCNGKLSEREKAKMRQNEQSAFQRKTDGSSAIRLNRRGCNGIKSWTTLEKAKSHHFMTVNLADPKAMPPMHETEFKQWIHTSQCHIYFYRRIPVFIAHWMCLSRKWI